MFTYTSDIRSRTSSLNLFGEMRRRLVCVGKRNVAKPGIIAQASQKYFRGRRYLDGMPRAESHLSKPCSVDSNRRRFLIPAALNQDGSGMARGIAREARQRFRE